MRFGAIVASAIWALGPTVTANVVGTSGSFVSLGSILFVAGLGGLGALATSPTTAFVANCAHRNSAIGGKIGKISLTTTRALKKEMSTPKPPQAPKAPKIPATSKPGSVKTGSSTASTLSDLDLPELKKNLSEKLSNISEKLNDLPSLPNLPDLPDLPDLKDLPTLPNLQQPLSKSSPSPPSSFTSSSTVPSLPSPPPPPPFDPKNPEALIAITKSFIATDFGIQTSQLPDFKSKPKPKSPSTSSPPDASSTSSLSSTSSPMPFYGPSLLSSDFTWVSIPNLIDGRTGILTKEEYLAAGRYFDLRGSFPDLEYRAGDFRIIYDEAGSYTNNSVNEDGDVSGVKEITVRFTTYVSGTFRGSPLKLRSKILQPNGKIMRCPPTSVSITFSIDKSSPDSIEGGGESNYGKITQLVTDAVMDRQVGNTNGLSGIAAAAFVAGETSNPLPPLVALERFFGRPVKPLVDLEGSSASSSGGGFVPPFPESVMIQLAKGITASNFGIEGPQDADLLAEDFVYLEPLMGPMNKETYLELFSGKFNLKQILDARFDLEYEFDNWRVDILDPFRVWVDARAQIVGSVSGSSVLYASPPEAMSFTFDTDGFCTRLTAAAVLNPLLGNTGGIGGVYGALYALGKYDLLGSSESAPNQLTLALRTRTWNALFNRQAKRLLSDVNLGGITGLGENGYRLSDGRVVVGGNGEKALSLPAVSSAKSAIAPTPPKLPPQSKLPPQPPVKKVSTSASSSTKEVSAPFFATQPTKTMPSSMSNYKAAPISEDPQDPVTEAFSSFFAVESSSDNASSAPAKTVLSSGTTDSKSERLQQLKQAAQAARLEATEAKRKAEEKKAEQQLRKKELKDRKEKEVKMWQMQQEKLKSSKKREASPSTKTSAPAKGSVSEATPTSKMGNAANKSPTFSLFGSPTSKSPLPKAKKEPTKVVTKGSASTSKAVPTLKTSNASKTSPTFSLFGAPTPKSTKSKSNTVVAKGSPKVPATEPATKSSPTISLFGSIGGASTKTSTRKETSAKKKISVDAPKKTPTFNLFGGIAPSSQSGKAQTSAASSNSSSEETAKRAPTFSLFGGGVAKGSSSKAKTAPKSASNVATKKSPKILPKSVTKTTGKKTAVKVAAKVPDTSKSQSLSESKSNSSFFGGLFGSSSDSKAVSKSGSIGNSKVKSKESGSTPPKGVPSLKQWKANRDGSITGRIFGSNAFKEGQTVTTSPIGDNGGRGVFSKGTVVRTESGSKYFLE